MQRDILFTKHLKVKSLYLLAMLGWTFSCSRQSSNSSVDNNSYKYSRDVIYLNSEQNSGDLETMLIGESDNVSTARFYVYGNIKDVDHRKIYLVNRDGLTINPISASTKKYQDDKGQTVPNVNILEVGIIGEKLGSVVSLKGIGKDAFSVNNTQSDKSPHKDIVYDLPLEISVSEDYKSFEIREIASLSRLKVIVEYYRAFDYRLEFDNSFQITSDKVSDSAKLVFEKELDEGTYRVVFLENKSPDYSYVFSSRKVKVDKTPPSLTEVDPENQQEGKLKIVSLRVMEIRMNELVSLEDKNKIRLIKNDKIYPTEFYSISLEEISEFSSRYAGEQNINDNFSYATRIRLTLPSQFEIDAEYGIKLESHAFEDREGLGNLTEETETDTFHTLEGMFTYYEDFL